MATTEVADAATKQRIIVHMNADHHDSVRAFRTTDVNPLQSLILTADTPIRRGLRLQVHVPESQRADGRYQFEPNGF